MSRPLAITLVLAVLAGAAFWVALREELADRERELARALERGDALAARARDLERTLLEGELLAQQLALCREASAAAGGDSCACAAAVPCPGEIVLTPGGGRLESPAERSAWLRSQLDRRLEEAWLEGEIGDAERHRAIDLLMQIRELRRSGGAGGSEVIRAQEEFIDLTGVGVGEFLERLDPSVRRSRRPEEALVVQEGETRKRFQDEVSRRLGIVEPGSVERLRDGEWQTAE